MIFRITKDIQSQLTGKTKTPLLTQILPFEPLNIGVATLDALDAFGNPRNIVSSSAHGAADYLTSKPLDASGYTQLYFSFYFQPEGIGNAPEGNDILELDI